MTKTQNAIIHFDYHSTFVASLILFYKVFSSSSMLGENYRRRLFVVVVVVRVTYFER